MPVTQQTLAREHNLAHFSGSEQCFLLSAGGFGHHVSPLVPEEVRQLPEGAASYHTVPSVGHHGRISRLGDSRFDKPLYHSVLRH